VSGAPPAAPAGFETPRARVIDALRGIPSLAGADVTAVTRLDGMTNSTYLVRLSDRRVVVRMPSPGDDPVVDRAVELANARTAAADGLGPQIVHADPVRQLLVTRYVAGAPLTWSSVRRGTTIERVARSLAQLHRVDARRFRGRFAVGTVLERYRRRLADVGDRLDADDVALLRRARSVHDVLDRSSATVPCHNDPWPSNIIETGGRLVLVDWEYSGVGDPLWDLAHFSVEAGLDADQTDRLLYAWSGRPATRRLRTRLSLWLPLTDVVWGLWARVQHRGGNVGVDLPAYAARRLRRARRLLDDDLVMAALHADH
jgi:thiamine kinase-like enzyme